jgi:hypothetical protein
MIQQIADIRGEIEEAESSPSQDDEDLEANGPMLLDGGQATYDLPTVMRDMPPKDVVDKLIFRYFNSAENSIGAYIAARDMTPF